MRPLVRRLPYVRWNFFTDATVTFGDEVWVRDGTLVVK